MTGKIGFSGHPVLDHFRRSAVNLEPRQRFVEHAAVRERPLRAWACAEIAHAALEPDDLPQPLDVAPRERQLAEPRPRFAPAPGMIRRASLI